MAPIAGKYQHYKNENIDEYFRAVGVPYIGRKMIAMSSPLMEIAYNQETMTIKNTSLMRTLESSFKIGVEFEEHMPTKTIKSTTTFINDNEMETKSIIPDTNESCSRHYLFTDDECVVGISRMLPKTKPGGSLSDFRHKATENVAKKTMFFFSNGRIWMTLTHDKAKTPGKRYFKRL